MFHVVFYLKSTHYYHIIAKNISEMQMEKSLRVLKSIKFVSTFFVLYVFPYAKGNPGQILGDSL